jgi:tetratricopeptide (TPR) repeat protein
LDWVVMKALEKDRSRRYGSATEFAADVERFLNHEPVQAGPPTVRYRTRKFVRRNRGPVLAAAVVAVALLCGTIGTTLGLVRAEHHWGVAVAERIRAQQAEADTLADYRAATDDAVEQLIGARPELGPKERAYLESTLKRWQAYANRQGDDERSRAIRGEGHFRVAWLWARLGREEEAEAEYRAAIDIRRALVEQFPESPDHRDELARTHQNLGALYRRLGRRDAERAEHEAARDHRTELVRRFPDEPDFQLELAGTTRQLGIDHTELGEFDRARAAFEASRDTLTGLAAIHSTVPALRRGLADSHFCLGRLFDELRQGPAARAEFEAARDLQAGLVAEAPESSEYRQDLAMTHNSLGNLFRATRQPADARREFREAITHFRRLAEEYPGIPEYEQKLAATRSNLGIVLSEVGAWAEARAEFAAASALQTRLVGRFPGSPEYWNELANTHNNWGVVLARDEGKPVEAIEHFDLAVRALQPLSEKNPRDVVLARELSNGYANRARAYDLLGRFSDAARDWDRAVALTPSPLREHYRVRRAIARLQAGLVAEAMAEVAELTARAPGAARPAWDAAEWYDIACAYAIATRTGADRTAEYAARAVEMLRIAVECGYRDAAHMAKDADLDALRGRDDFKALLTDLEKRFPKTPKDQPLQKSGGHSKKRKGDIVSHGRSRCPLFRSTVRHDI